MEVLRVAGLLLTGRPAVPAEPGQAGWGRARCTQVHTVRCRGWRNHVMTGYFLWPWGGLISRLQVGKPVMFSSSPKPEQTLDTEQTLPPDLFDNKISSLPWHK